MFLFSSFFVLLSIFSSSFTGFVMDSLLVPPAVNQTLPCGFVRQEGRVIHLLCQSACSITRVDRPISAGHRGGQSAASSGGNWLSIQFCSESKYERGLSWRVNIHIYFSLSNYHFFSPSLFLSLSVKHLGFSITIRAIRLKTSPGGMGSCSARLHYVFRW